MSEQQGHKEVLGAAAARNTGDVYRTELEAAGRQLVADEPLALGGKDSGPSPADYLCMALASCKAITLRMYAGRKGWALAEVNVQVEFVRGTQLPSGVTTFFCRVALTGDLDATQRQRLLEIARSCPVDRLLTKPSAVETELL